ncbi:MAG: phage shock protein operon transcriptional activator [Deltaproteobacteria bacterium]|nr:phage shock protein operon transcriptional activator [Deltaproteobacteria bacterium]MBW1961806.1 phage shock protein operon transcriptional activator [Deltaproteobacteria bacterium]MBW1995317.1 phage shock protein operon transcriptional activator [Deltaproteobacteria bacterium]MBW2152256.1 phage shock protein operon transcriptional activator [Deltaproteobacteria bacterium]
MPVGMGEALGQSEAFLLFQERLSRVAPINRPVLLLGERGTGKELAASRLHYLSDRWQGPLVALNCAALSASLIESELFGYEKGAFTGAQQRRTGRFEAADGGTLFLDEIGNIPIEVQEKILRIVEYNTFERVGSSETLEVDVRIIASTNADLIDLSQRGRFKKDLLDRLSFEVLYLPPLRERKEDIMLLANHFAARMTAELGREKLPRFSDRAADDLLAYDWPGNIRELKNTVERAVYRSDSNIITSIDFNPFSSPYMEKASIAGGAGRQLAPEKTSCDELLCKPINEAVRELKTRMLEKALKETRYNQKEAARRLGLTYHQFRGLYRQLKDQVK